MKLNVIARELGLECLTPELSEACQVEVARGHVSDLLSDVLGRAPAGSVLATIQVHLNVVAVAINARLAGVIFTSGRMPDEEVCQAAVREGMPLLRTGQSSFDLVGRLYQLGLRGRDA
jgi:hypothetical protein